MINLLIYERFMNTFLRTKKLLVLCKKIYIPPPALSIIFVALCKYISYNIYVRCTP